MLNQLVGIVGTTTYDRALKLNIITIDRAVLLEAEGELKTVEEETEQPAEAPAEETAEEPAK